MNRCAGRVPERARRVCPSGRDVDQPCEHGHYYRDSEKHLRNDFRRTAGQIFVLNQPAKIRKIARAALRPPMRIACDRSERPFNDV